jgi:hypothetical protein
MKSQLTLGFLTVLFSTSVYAGDSAHGGGAIVCKDTNGKIESAELLDFWEASVLKGLKIIKNENPVKQQVASALEKLNRWKPSLGQDVQKIYDDLLLIRQDVPVGVAITPPSDADLTLIKEGCELEGVAKHFRKYPDPAILYMNPRLISHLPKTDQAALWLHEAIYKSFRQKYSAKDSTEARRFTSLLFSDKKFLGVPFEQAQLMECVGNGPNVYISRQNSTIRLWAENDYEYGVTYKEIESLEVTQLMPFAFSPVSESIWKTLPQAPSFELGTQERHFTITFHKGFTFDPKKPGFPWMNLIKSPFHEFHYLGCTPYTGN